MNVSEQNYLEIARLALAECSTPAEIHYVSDSLGLLYPDPRAKQLLSDLVSRYLSPRTQSIPA